MSETLRQELAPLGVRVVTGMLGSVESNFYANDSWQGLSETSRYKSVEPYIAKKMESRDGQKQENVEDFARNFVGDVLSGAEGQVWRGKMAQTCRILGGHGPAWFLVCWNCVVSLGVNFYVGRNEMLIWNHRIIWCALAVAWMFWERSKGKSDGLDVLRREQGKK